MRSFTNEDMSNYINRVQFRLHETYPNNVRGLGRRKYIFSIKVFFFLFVVIHQAPFEIEESGWGEFETQITIFFVDPNEKPVTFSLI